jgi:indolepyruvate ferredoxin oxidoreductase beta subunit
MAKKNEKFIGTEPFLNILIVGVGGQGVMTAGKFFHLYGASDPKIYNFVGIESRGVSQREGSVKAIIRYILDEKYAKIPFSPSLLPQSVDLLIAFEPLEFFRYLQYLRSDAVVILNSQPLIPKSCFLKSKMPYPDINQLISAVKDEFPYVQFIIKNYHELALEQYRSSVKSNLLILRELIEVKSKISSVFSKSIYQILLEQIFPENTMDSKKLD